MNRIIKYFVFFIFISTAICQEHHEFKSEDWIGIWKGNLLISYPSSTSSIPMQLEISKTDTDNKYNWKTTYGEGEKIIFKNYYMYPVNINKGSWILDEDNSIFIDFYFSNNKFYSLFEVQQTILSSMYRLENGNLYFEITSSKFDSPVITGEEKSKVSSYPVYVVQSATLTK